jgi:hypothetical protein
MGKTEKGKFGRRGRKSGNEGEQTRSEVRQEWNRRYTQIKITPVVRDRHTRGYAAPAAQYAEWNRIPIQFRNTPLSGFICVHRYPSVAK